MKRLLDNLLLLAVMAGAGYALYHYLRDPPEKPTVKVRYGENEQETMFHEREEAGSGIDDCYRYVNPDSVEGCLERRGKTNTD